MSTNLHTLLSIAGSDPVGGAGIQADIRSGNLLGLHVMTAITAITAQNSHKVKEVFFIPPKLLKDQLDSVIEDVMPDSIKIGLIGSEENFLIISDFLKSLPSNVKVVIDPVIKASSDGRLMINLKDIKEIISLYINYLFPFSTVITPNLYELKMFSDNVSDLCSKEILDHLHANSIVLTGGHSKDKIVTDTLITSDGISKFSHPRYNCHNLHGTGCTYSSILASFLALGNDLKKAVSLTSSKISEIISRSCDYSLGSSIYGPLNINYYTI